MSDSWKIFDLDMPTKGSSIEVHLYGREGVVDAEYDGKFFRVSGKRYLPSSKGGMVVAWRNKPTLTGGNK